MGCWLVVGIRLVVRAHLLSNLDLQLIILISY